MSTDTNHLHLFTSGGILYHNSSLVKCFMKMVNPHYAKDRRCYNGACCSDLQKEIDAKAEARKQLEELGGESNLFPSRKFFHRVCGNKDCYT